jgi:hypothetical protein
MDDDNSDEDGGSSKYGLVLDLNNPKKISKKFEFFTTNWKTTTGSLLKAGKHKINIKFENIQWNSNTM